MGKSVLKHAIIAGILSFTAATSIVVLSKKDNRQRISKYIGNITVHRNIFSKDIAQLVSVKNNLTQQISPLITTSVKEVQTTLRHFNEDNQPRIRRVNDKLLILTRHLNEAISKAQNDTIKLENQE